MSLYYNTITFELKDIDDSFMLSLEQNNNPKFNNYTLAPEKPSDDAIWNNGSWIIPPAISPDIISARQVRIWLVQNGISLSQVEEAINNIEDAQLRDITKIEWEYAPYIERTHPMLPVLAEALGLNTEILDLAFIQASSI